jgi:hypothetical protein
VRLAGFEPETVEIVPVLFAGVDAHGAGWLLDMGLAKQRVLLDARGVPGQILPHGTFREVVER